MIKKEYVRRKMKAIVSRGIDKSIPLAQDLEQAFFSGKITRDMAEAIQQRRFRKPLREQKLFAPDWRKELNGEFAI